MVQGYEKLGIDRRSTAVALQDGRRPPWIVNSRTSASSVEDPNIEAPAEVSGSSTRLVNSCSLLQHDRCTAHDGRSGRQVLRVVPTRRAASDAQNLRVVSELSHLHVLGFVHDIARLPIWIGILPT